MKNTARLLGALLVLSNVGRARAHPPVHLQVDPCVATDESEVSRALAVELGEPLRASIAGAIRIEIACRGDSTIVRVRDPIGDRSIDRSIELSRWPLAARTRMLAIAVSELVSMSWMELEAHVPMGASTAGGGASHYGGALHYELDAVGTGRGWWSGAGLLGGGGLRFAARYAHHLGFDLDLVATGGNVLTALGRISIGDLSGHAALLLHREWTKIGIFGDVGLRVGGVHLSGSPSSIDHVSGSSGWGAWLGPAATFGICVMPVSRLRLGLAGEVGYAAVPVRGLVAGVATVSVSGAWLSFQATIGLAL